MKIYEVGGAVRDALLNEKAKDKDWVVVGAPTTTQSLSLAFSFSRASLTAPPTSYIFIVFLSEIFFYLLIL